MNLMTTFPGIMSITDNGFNSTMANNSTGDLVISPNSGKLIVNNTIQATTLIGTLVPAPSIAVINFASLARIGTQVLSSGNSVIFTNIDLHGTITANITMTAVTIGSTGYYIIVAGITKTTGSGTTMGLRINGIAPPAILQFDNSLKNMTNARQWILHFNIGDTIELINTGSTNMTIGSTVSAYLNFIQIAS